MELAVSAHALCAAGQAIMKQVYLLPVHKHLLGRLLYLAQIMVTAASVTTCDSQACMCIIYDAEFQLYLIIMMVAFRRACWSC